MGKKRDKKRAIIVIVLIMVLTIAATAAVLKMTDPLNFNTQTSEDQEEERGNYAEDADSILDSAEAALSEGRFDDAARRLDESKERFREEGDEDRAKRAEEVRKAIDPGSLGEAKVDDGTNQEPQRGAPDVSER
jgi:hypothetical protein